MVHRTKAVNALELFDRCRGNGAVFEWMTFDAGCGMDKKFLHAPRVTPLEAQPHVAFSRWHLEKCFQEEKSELGLSHFEVRTFRSMMRHFIPTSMSHLYLAQEYQRLAVPPRGMKSN